MNYPEKYDSTLRFLYGLQMFGIKVGLKNIQSILQFAGNPENYFPSIHIAGTNGKGSTASMIASILTASGYRTGLYTSPHLVDFSERIRINGEKISSGEIIYYTKLFRNEIDKHEATFFEATTAIAYKYFADENVDIVVIETGLGGRWDATNVITPVLSIITNIGIEHEKYLGHTHARIAKEKGGIIKPFIPCVTSTDNEEALRQLRKISKSNNSPLVHIDENSSIRIKEISLRGSSVDLETGENKYDNLFVSLSGEHQVNNLRLAVFASEYLKNVENFSKISIKTIRRGLSSIRGYAGLRGRMETVQNHPVVVADVAHNPHGIRTLTRTLQRILAGKAVVVFGAMKDKDYSAMIENLEPIVRKAIVVTPETERANSGSILLNKFHNRRISAIDGGSVVSGYKRAISECNEGTTMIVTGSHYVVGELYKYLNISP